MTVRSATRGGMGRQLMLLVVVGVVAAALVTLWWTTRFTYLGSASTLATVVDRGIERGARVTSYWLSYQFSTPAGQSLGGRGYVPASEWERRPAGSQIEIRYVPSSPETNEPVINTHEPVSGYFVVSLFLSLWFASALWIVRRAATRRSAGAA